MGNFRVQNLMFENEIGRGLFSGGFSRRRLFEIQLFLRAPR